jgi:hypothetical protein
MINCVAASSPGNRDNANTADFLTSVSESLDAASRKSPTTFLPRLIAIQNGAQLPDLRGNILMRHSNQLRQTFWIFGQR